jgi:hypothetical protein
MWWINVHGNVYLSSSFNYKPRYGLPNWPHKRESCWLEKGRCERKESNVVLVQQECLKGTYGSSLADWVIASIDDTTGSCASLSFCTSKTNTRWWPKHVTTEDGVYSSWLGGVNKNSKKKSCHKLTKMNVVAMLTEINRFFQLGNSEELICSVTISRNRGGVNYELDSAAGVFARSASIIALM